VVPQRRRCSGEKKVKALSGRKMLEVGQHPGDQGTEWRRMLKGAQKT